MYWATSFILLARCVWLMCTDVYLSAQVFSEGPQGTNKRRCTHLAQRTCHTVTKTSHTVHGEVSVLPHSPSSYACGRAA